MSCLSPAVGSVVPPRAHCVSLQSGQSPRVLYPFCVTPEAPESSDYGPSSPSNGPIRKTATVVRECLPASFFSPRISGVTLKLEVAGPPHLRSGTQLLLRSQGWLWGEPLDPGNRTRFSQGARHSPGAHGTSQKPQKCLCGAIIRLQGPRSAVTKFNMNYYDYSLKSQEIYTSSQGLIALCCGSPTPTPPSAIFSAIDAQLMCSRG